MYNTELSSRLDLHVAFHQWMFSSPCWEKRKDFITSVFLVVQFVYTHHWTWQIIDLLAADGFGWDYFCIFIIRKDITHFNSIHPQYEQKSDICI